MTATTIQARTAQQAQTLFELAMIKTISAHFPFSVPELSVVYDEVKSFDKIKDVCEFCLIWGYSDLLAGYVNMEKK